MMKQRDALELAGWLRLELEATKKFKTPTGRARHEQAKYMVYLLADPIRCRCEDFDENEFYAAAGVEPGATFEETPSGTICHTGAKE